MSTPPATVDRVASHRLALLREVYWRCRLPLGPPVPDHPTQAVTVREEWEPITGAYPTLPVTVEDGYARCPEVIITRLERAQGDSGNLAGAYHLTLGRDSVLDALECRIPELSELVRTAAPPGRTAPARTLEDVDDLLSGVWEHLLTNPYYHLRRLAGVRVRSHQRLTLRQFVADVISNRQRKERRWGDRHSQPAEDWDPSDPESAGVSEGFWELMERHLRPEELLVLRLHLADATLSVIANALSVEVLGGKRLSLATVQRRVEAARQRSHEILIAHRMSCSSPDV